ACWSRRRSRCCARRGGQPRWPAFMPRWCSCRSCCSARSRMPGCGMPWPEAARQFVALAARLLVALGLGSGCLLAAAQSAPPSDGRRADETSQAAIGSPVGDFELRDASGKTVRLSDYRGAPLLVSFIYTGCFQICPTSTRFLAQAVNVARKALGEDRFHVVSIGFNQPFDDPVAMASFARQVGISDPRWSFLSPAAGDVEALTRR